MKKFLFIFIFFLIPSLVHAGPDGFLYKRWKYYYFQGRWAAKTDNPNKTQRISMARETAILEGKAKIAFYIDGLKMKKGGSVGEAKRNDEVMNKKISLILDGVGIVKTEWDDQDDCKVILKINRKSVLKALKARE